MKSSPSTPHPSPDEHIRRKKVTRRTKTALWLLIGPTLLIALTFVLFALINLVFNPTFWPTPDTEALTSTPIAITIVNVILFFAGSIGVISWLPGIIVGAILLTTAPKASQ